MSVETDPTRLITAPIYHDRSLTYTLHYVTTPELLARATAWVEAQPVFGLDFETSGLDPFTERVATIQVGNPLLDVPEVFVVDVRCFTDEELRPFLKAVMGPKRKKLGQNIRFECRFALTNFGMNVWNVKDTQVTEMIIRAGLLPLARGGGDEQNDRAAYGAASMAALARRYLGIKIKKDVELRTGFYKTPAGCHNQEQLEYAAGDVVYIFYIDQEQQKEVDARALGDILKIEHELVPILAQAEHVGMGMNPDAWLSLWQEAVAGRIAAENRLHDLMREVEQLELLAPPRSGYKMLYPRTGRALNFSSPAQIKYAITTYCRHVNWPVKIVTTEDELIELKKAYGKDWHARKLKDLKKRHGEDVELPWSDVPDFVIPEDEYCILLSTKAEVLRLARLKNHLPKPLVEALLEYAKYDIRETTFGKDFLTKYLKDDGRVHTDFHQCLTSTGRLSASPNLMNIPRDDRYRAAFIPRKGYKFVIADYSQIEPRLTAQESQDPVYLKTFLDDDDIYLNVAEAMLGHRPDKNTPEGALERQIFKVIVLAMAYRMGPSKLQRSLALAMEKEILEGKTSYPDFAYVRGLHEQFLKTFDKLHDFQNKCSELADPKKEAARVIWDNYLDAPVTWISALCGRKRFFPVTANNTYTEAANAPIQGCSATITKAAIVLIQKRIHKEGFDAQLVNVVHDELIYECREDQADEFAKIMQHCMEQAGKFYLPDVPVKAEFPKHTNGVVPCWMKEGKKPNG